MIRLRFLLPLVALLFVACEHRPLTDPDTSHYIRIYLDEEIRNVTYGFYNEAIEHPEYEHPKVMRVLLADPVTDVVVAERYLQNQGQDERGYYFEGYIQAPAGKYNLMTYSFGSAVTLIGNENSFYAMEAYTDALSDHYLQYIPSSRVDVSDAPIRYAPEHIFHEVAEPLVIKHSSGVDTLYAPSGDYFRAHTMVKSYYLQVRVSGFEWIHTAVSLLSGMAGSVKMHAHNEINTEAPVNVFFPMKYTDKKAARDATTATLYATFNTFGKIPDATSIYTLNLEFVRGDGSSQVEQIDITALFDTPMAREKQWLILDHEIVVTPPEGATNGGMSPGVNKWEDVEGDLQM